MSGPGQRTAKLIGSRLERKDVVFVKTIIVLICAPFLLLLPAASTAEAKITAWNVEHLLPAPQSTVDWARHWRRITVCEWRKWNRARVCLGMRRQLFASPQPPRRANQAEWLAVGREWKHRVRPGGVRDYQDRTRALVRRMTHPGGSGSARWLPLARYVGWPRSLSSALTLCIRLESGGRPGAQNWRYHGLMQIYRGSYTPRSNLAQGYRMWCARGWQPWPPMIARGYR